MEHEAKGTVITVSGKVNPESLGITLPHEHILCDGSCWWKEPEENDVYRRSIADLPMSMNLLGVIRRAPTQSVRTNLVLSDAELAVRELLEFGSKGGSTIVDATNLGLGRDPLRLKDIAMRTGLCIILGSGFYVQASHPSYVSHKTVEDLASMLVREVREGIDGSKIHPGLLGEIGLSPGILPPEEKILTAAFIAQSQTGLPVSIHSWVLRQDVSKIMEIANKMGCDPHRIVLAHCDASSDGTLDVDLQKEIAKFGMYVEYDLFGSEEFRRSQQGMVQLPRDYDRVGALKELIDAGYLQSILISQDICRKHQLKEYGGWGYSHILENIVPVLRSRGFTQEMIGKIMVENPRQVLTVK